MYFTSLQINFFQDRKHVQAAAQACTGKDYLNVGVIRSDDTTWSQQSNSYKKTQVFCLVPNKEGRTAITDRIT